MDVGIIYRTARPQDVEGLAALETASYPRDEAASQQILQNRIEWAPDCTLLAETSDGVGGFVCGTRSPQDRLTHDSMSAHDPAGSSLCIHSVVVAAVHRRRGFGQTMVAAYVEHARGLGGVERLLLMSKDHLLEFYRRAGFIWVGPSPIVHGADPWHEMRLDLR